MDVSYEIRASLRRAGIRSIELKRGNTLKLEHAAGATARLVDGSAWLSTGHSSQRMRAGKAIPVSGSGTTLIYALEDASLCLEASELCGFELRRRGAVTALASSQRDDQRVNVDDASEVARWADLLCTSPEQLRKAIAVVGPQISNVKRYLFVALVREHAMGQRS
jgi:L-asparaginase II